jgi:glutathione peroxidase
MTDIYGFGAALNDGTEVELSRYRGKVLLIVNTASRCGYTPQYRALQELYLRYHDRGFEVLAFPCNQFGKQEPGNAVQIRDFCKHHYHTTFPLFAKIEVNGKNAHPLFKHLKAAAPGVLGTRFIKWNFTKFLVKKDGSVYKRYATRTAPEKLTDDIETLLAQ